MRAPVEIVAAVFERDGRFLLGLRAAHKRVLPEHWDLIGGHIEPGETPEACLTREVAEEIAVRVEAFERLGEATYIRFDGADILQHVFRVTAWSGEPSLANEEHTELSWFTADGLAALPNLAAQEYVPLLRAVLA